MLRIEKISIISVHISTMDQEAEAQLDAQNNVSNNDDKSSGKSALVLFYYHMNCLLNMKSR